MNRSLILLFTLFVFLLIGCTSSKNDASSEDWTEMEAYHMIMAETFHPMEEGNMEPVKARAEELANIASQWSSSRPPKSLRSKQIKQQIGIIENMSASVAELVKRNAPDQQIISQMNELHDQFHKVVGICND